MGCLSRLSRIEMRSSRDSDLKNSSFNRAWCSDGSSGEHTR